MAAQPSKGLGKGLSALMGDSAIVRGETVAPRAVAAPVAAAAAPETELPVSALIAGKYQPRRHFDDAQIEELSSSIKKHGLMQPIVVRALEAGGYEIIAGERRFRAAKHAGLKTVPVIIRKVTDSEALELGLIENIQRADLNPLEEAAGYQRLIEEFGYTQEKLAPVVGKSRSHIANLLRLLKLPESVKARIDTGELTMGHARAILMAKDPEELAKQVIEVGLSVRQAEDLAKGKVAPSVAVETPSVAAIGAALAKHPSAPRATPAPVKNDDVLQLEAMLSENLGLAVSINTANGHSGEVVIGYGSLTQLDEILRRMGGSI